MAEPRTFGDPRGPANVGAANLVDRGVRITVADGGNVGKRDEVFITTTLQGEAPGALVLEHALGRMPTYARVWCKRAGPTNDSVFDVIEVNKKVWSSTTVQVLVTKIGGTLAGSELCLAVG